MIALAWQAKPRAQAKRRQQKVAVWKFCNDIYHVYFLKEKDDFHGNNFSGNLQEFYRYEQKSA